MRSARIDLRVLFTMERFYKTKDCPASEKLAALADSESVGEELRRHLSRCEFCAAELEFYRLYPPREEHVELADIPEPLFELADALLHKRRDVSELYELAGKGD
ncbi:MAG: hypothetical protein ABIO91_07160 [Pyrinomonadaceae bacterium]